MTTFQFSFAGATQRLDQFLAAQLKNQLSRAAVQKLIEAGSVTIDGYKILAKDFRLSGRHEVVAEYTPPTLQARPDIGLPIVYEDEDVLLLNKPAGLVVHPNPGQTKASLAAGLIAHRPDLAGVGDQFRPGIVHRLDADTSGLIIVAKSKSALEFLQRQFAERKVVKFYTALVHGKLEKPDGSFNLSIGRKPRTQKFTTGFGRTAFTEYHSLRVYRRGLDDYTLVRIQLHTGRTHQIRVHFAGAGHPVCGDRLYGGKFKKVDTHIFPRQFLHADYLKLHLPSGSKKEFKIPLAEDLQKILTSFDPNS